MTMCCQVREWPHGICRRWSGEGDDVDIWWRFGPRWRDRQAALLETLRQVDPDVVALQEVWGSDETTQADEFAAALGLFAGFAEPSYPAVPDPPQLADHEGITLGLGVLSRWPITSMRPVGTPGRG